MASGSQIIINKNGVTVITPGKFESKAGQHKFENGAKVKYQLPHIPDVSNPYVLQYLVKNKENQAMVNKPYLSIDEDGNIRKGKTDENGFMQLTKMPSPQKVTTWVMMNEIEQAKEEDIED
ncbi:hypothetical protein D7V21_02010 [Acinetobacter guerrae]|uniref:Uncharacterized protein n=1 Tax=Acinetobacter guerrae TaxID=1843371 RepID=A0A3A8EY55_9GAMM|nr:hypothetical protein [Acinetobacter guerrae]RKG35670.1 hypothetical protein D7V21_02010 [Acinetobacter guerrae]